MLRFVWSELRRRPSRPAALAVAILVAAAGFVLLSSTAKTTDIRVKGSVESNFRNAYDILVRPRGSFTQIERSEGLVRNNYLSGIFGGITLEQYERMKRIRGVEVAAPIANLGYILPFGGIVFPLDHLLTREAVQLFRLRLGFVAQRGLSRYEDEDLYVYYTRQHRFEYGEGGVSELVPGRGRLNVCNGFRLGKPYREGPAADWSYVYCFSELSPGQGSDVPNYEGRTPYGKVTSYWNIHFPIFVAAIDPVQEARLLRLDKTVVSGRYLREQDRMKVITLPSGGRRRAVPAIASTKTYLDERLLVEIERLQPAAGTDVPQVLSSSAAYRFLTRLPGRVVERRLFAPDTVYQRMLRRAIVDSSNYWGTSEVRYRPLGDERIAPAPVVNPISIWKAPQYIDSGGYMRPPPSNGDLQFRHLRAFVGSNIIGADEAVRASSFRLVGRYDPAKLPGFSPLSQLPMETYYPPILEPGDEASKKALDAEPLLPTQNLGDYAQQPPLLLISLEGLKPFLSAVNYFGAKGKAKAPISVVRVRVAGVRGPDELSQARIRRVAIRIRELTSLDVDITAGSSPRELFVALPKGKFGRPPLLLKEGWVKKGVSVSFLRALDDKRLGLFALILVTSAFFLANGAFAVTRARRTEIGTLLCLGWRQGEIFRTVLGELAVIGLVAGALGVALAAGFATVFSLDVPLARTLLVLPLSVLLAVLAGLLPAWRAARSVPLDAVRPQVAGTLRSRRVRRLLTLALSNVRRVPARSLVGAAGVFVGVAALTLLLAVNWAFQGTLVGTLLGEAISLQVRGLDFVAVALIVGLGALSLADVLFLNLRERAGELTALRTVGWQGMHLGALIVLEALWLGLLGSVSGAGLGLLLGAQLGVPFWPLALATGIAGLGGVLVALLASALPLSRLAGLTPARVLAEE